MTQVVSKGGPSEYYQLKPEYAEVIFYRGNAKEIRHRIESFTKDSVGALGHQRVLRDKSSRRLVLVSEGDTLENAMANGDYISKNGYGAFVRRSGMSFFAAYTKAEIDKAMQEGVFLPIPQAKVKRLMQEGELQ